MTVQRVLCVDDEPHVLAGLERNLRRLCPVVTAVGGAAALDILRRDRNFAVIISDMRMPELNGAQFLREARLLVPDSVRILLTGEADLDAVVAAVNEGHIQHYLRKPVEREALHAMVQRAFFEYAHAQQERERAWTMARAGAGLALGVLRNFAPDAAEHAERSAKLALELGERLGLASLRAVELTAWLGVISKRMPERVANEWVEQLLTDEQGGVRIALAELRTGVSIGAVARVVAAAWLHDELTHARLSDAERHALLERSVDARTLAALQDLSPRPQAA